MEFTGRTRVCKEYIKRLYCISAIDALHRRHTAYKHTHGIIIGSIP